jgi:hypothetical protein
MIFFCRDINASLQSIPPAITVITVNISTGHIESYFPGLLILEVEIPYQGNYYSTCPAYAQNNTVKTDSG